MANKINYAENWESEILEIINQNTLTSPVLAKADSYKFTGANVVHLTQMSVSGYQDHDRNGGFKKGSINQTPVDLMIEHDRSVLLAVDKADVDESNGTASIDNASKVFVSTQQSPEIDARCFERVYASAEKEGQVQELDMSTVTKDNAVTMFKDLANKGKLRLYRSRGSLIAYVNTHFMNCLEMSTERQLKVELTAVADGGIGIETRVTNIDGIYIFEVIDDERFYSKFDYTDGFIATEDAKKLAVVFMSTEKVKTIPKIESIYHYEPGEQVTLGDSYGYANRSQWDTFVIPNGTTGKVDSVFVAYEKVSA